MYIYTYLCVCVCVYVYAYVFHEFSDLSMLVRACVRVNVSQTYKMCVGGRGGHKLI